MLLSVIAIDIFSMHKQTAGSPCLSRLNYVEE